MVIARIKRILSLNLRRFQPYLASISIEAKSSGSIGSKRSSMIVVEKAYSD